MSWSAALARLGSESNIEGTLQYCLYDSNAPIIIYYFSKEICGIPALLRFVDPETGEPVSCPVMNKDYYMEVKGPPFGEGVENEYLIIVYQSETSAELPPGPSFTYSSDKFVGNKATYFRATGTIKNYSVPFIIYRADYPDVFTYINLYMLDYPFDCNRCGCLPNEDCYQDGICVPAGIEPPVEPPVEPEDPCQNKACGGSCYGQCPGAEECLLQSGQYSCVLKSPPFWTEWWFWLIIIGTIFLLIILLIILLR